MALSLMGHNLYLLAPQIGQVWHCKSSIKMGFTISRCLYFFVAFMLCFVSFALVFNGPILNYFMGKTEYIEKFYQKTEIAEPIKWPSLLICKNPSIKSQATFLDMLNKGLAKQFSSQDELMEMLEDTFYTKTNEIVIGLGISKDYASALKQAKAMPLQKPYIENVFGDLAYFGYCSVISLEALKTYMITKGDITDSDFDSPFNLVVWMQVSLYYKQYHYVQQYCHL